MKHIRTCVLIVAIAALIAAPAFAQTPRQDATGGGFAAVSIDETASSNNPAGLPQLHTFGTEISPWPTRASINALVDGPDDSSRYSGFYAGRAADHSSGWGAALQHMDNATDTDALSVGYGQEIRSGFTAGASVQYQSRDDDDPDTDLDDTTSFDLGALYRKELPMNTWRFGLVVEDVADEYGGPFYNVGAAVELPMGVNIGATAYDLTDEGDSRFAVGAEWDMPMSDVIVRAGNHDGDFSAGVGYQWLNFELSTAWVDGDDDDWITAGVAGCF